MYYECHITISPVFGEELQRAHTLAQSCGFRVADLLMKKRQQDTPVQSKYDTFMTGTHLVEENLRSRMIELIMVLQSSGFKVWRYKIEHVILDSKRDDVLSLIGPKGATNG